MGRHSPPPDGARTRSKRPHRRQLDPAHRENPGQRVDGTGIGRKDRGPTPERRSSHGSHHTHLSHPTTPRTGPRDGPSESTRVVPPHRLGQKLGVEPIGAFFLIFTVGATVYSGRRSHRWPSAPPS